MIATDFTLRDQNNNEQSLNDYLGQWVVLYFYPKDDTPGCTQEACAFRDEHEPLLAKNAAVIGISKDSVNSHRKFAEKYNLPFALLSDGTKQVQQQYGAWGKKKFMGREYEGTLRKTFIIDPEGHIVKEYPDVTPAAHATQILFDLKELQGAGNV